MKKRVFISYSTLTAKPNVPDPDVATTCERLTERLEGAGFEALVDRRLRSGERWRHQIYRWIALCDAAVVLFSRSALEAPWVRKEVELLMWRWQLSGHKSPLILPFRLGNLQVNEISENEYSATFINQLQAPVLNDDALADEVVDGLAKLPPTALDTPLRQIESAIATNLASLSEHDLDQSLVLLNADSIAFLPEAADPVARKRELLAAVLLDSSLEQLREFLEMKAPSLGRGCAEFLVNWVASFRVDEMHGSSLFHCSKAEPPKLREIAIASQFPLTGRHYVARGYLRPKPPNVQTPVLRTDEHASEEAGVEALVDQVARTIVPGAQNFTRAQLKTILKGSKEPRFVALRLSSDHPELRQRLQMEFETVTFLYFTRNDQGAAVSVANIETIDVAAASDIKFQTDYLDALEVTRA